MYCSGCGQPLLEMQSFCPNCGNPTKPSDTPSQPSIPLLHIGLGRKLRALGFCWLANVALNVVILWVGYSHWDETPDNIRFITGIVIFAAWAGVLSGLIAAIGLLNLQTWGKTASIIAAIIALVNLTEFPIGTAIGIWALVVLLNAQNSVAYRDLHRTSGQE